MYQKKLALFATTAAIALAGSPANAQAAADQDAASQNSSESQADESRRTLGTVTVTARKVEESLQTTPVAVSALDEESLEKQQVVDVTSLQNLVPNLTISSAVAQPGSATFFIRGQGSSDGLIAVDQAVGVYVNGVYSARSTGGAADFVDIGRVEVLRGPQGTLFGRNTTGGAVNIIPNEPTTEKFEGLARVDYGNYNTLLLRGVANLPVNDEMAFRVAYQHREQDGFGKNLLLNEEVGGQDKDFVRASFLYDPTNAPVRVLLQADFTSLETGGEPVGLKSYTANSTNTALIYACSGLISGAEALAALCPYSVAGGDSYSNYLVGNGVVEDFQDVYNNTSTYGDVETYGYSATFDFDLGENLALKSISGWRGVDMSSLSDNDGTPYVLSGGLLSTDGNFINQDQFSQELQLTGTNFDNRLNWILGAYYFEEEGNDQSRSASVYPLSLSIGIVDADITNKSIAGYAQGTYALTNDVRITAGLRYTDDTREMVARNRDRNALTGVETSSLTSFLDGDADDPFRASFERSYDYWSYTFGIDWQAMENLFLYAKTSRAYRSGGLNTRAVEGGIPPVSFEPEEVTDYEIGSKFDFWSGRGRLNAAIYYTDFQNVQRSLIGVSGSRLVAGIDNAASAHITGGELEFAFLPVEGLTLSGSVGLTNPEYDEFVNSINGTDMSNTPFIYTPEETYTLSADYELPIGIDGTLNFHADYSLRSDAFATPLKDDSLTAAENAALQNTARIDGYGLLNGRISWQVRNSGVELAIYGSNLTDEEYETRLLSLEGTPLGVTSYYPGAPRTFGISATAKF